MGWCVIGEHFLSSNMCVGGGRGVYVCVRVGVSGCVWLCAWVCVRVCGVSVCVCVWCGCVS